MAVTVSVPGYARVKVPGARGLVIESCKDTLAAILSSETLHAFAARQPDARTFKGRATAYGIDLGPGCGRVVVRHAMRGGLIGQLTGSDLFLPPTRGLRELVNSIRLKLAGIPTPEVVAFLSYPAGMMFRRSDVATREIPDSHDLAVVLREITDEHRPACLEATGKLLALLARGGAHHPDLNARNVLISWGDEGAHAHILDVDRIRFHVGGDPMVSRANFARLERSLKKLRERENLAISDDEIAAIRTASEKSVA